MRSLWNEMEKLAKTSKADDVKEVKVIKKAPVVKPKAKVTAKPSSTSTKKKAPKVKTKTKIVHKSPKKKVYTKTVKSKKDGTSSMPPRVKNNSVGNTINDFIDHPSASISAAVNDAKQYGKSLYDSTVDRLDGGGPPTLRRTLDLVGGKIGDAASVAMASGAKAVAPIYDPIRDYWANQTNGVDNPEGTRHPFSQTLELDNNSNLAKAYKSLADAAKTTVNTAARGTRKIVDVTNHGAGTVSDYWLNETDGKANKAGTQPQLATDVEELNKYMSLLKAKAKHAALVDLLRKYL